MFVLHAASRTTVETATMQQSLVFASSAMPKLQPYDMLTPDVWQSAHLLQWLSSTY